MIIRTWYHTAVVRPVIHKNHRSADVGAPVVTTLCYLKVGTSYPFVAPAVMPEM